MPILWAKYLNTQKTINIYMIRYGRTYEYWDTDQEGRDNMPKRWGKS